MILLVIYAHYIETPFLCVIMCIFPDFIIHAAIRFKELNCVVMHFNSVPVLGAIWLMYSCSVGFTIYCRTYLPYALVLLINLLVMYHISFVSGQTVFYAFPFAPGPIEIFPDWPEISFPSEYKYQEISVPKVSSYYSLLMAT